MTTEEGINIAKLITDSLTGEISPEETRILDKWLSESEANMKLYRQWQDRMGEDLPEEKGFADFKDFDYTLTAAASGRSVKRRRAQLRLWLPTAAAVLLIGLVSAYYIEKNKNTTRHIEANGIVYGEPSAVLIVDGGRRIALTPKASSLRVGNTMIDTENGRSVVSYDGTLAVESDTPVSVHRLMVGVGNEHTVILPDGTKAHVDAVSEISYPERFTGQRREIYAQGRVYLEVAHDPDVPFIVKTPSSEIRVHGTEFCIEDYHEGNSLVTLVKGSISVVGNPDQEPRMLRPGQQANISADACCVKDVDPMYYIGWKDGYFIYEASTIDDIMKDISRWYGMSYEFSDPAMKENVVSARFVKYRDIDSLTAIFSSMNNMNIVRVGEKLIIRNRSNPE